MAGIAENCGDDDTATLTPGTDRTDSEGQRIPMSEGARKSSLSVLRLQRVCRLTGLARSTIYRMQTEGQFPQRIRLGTRAVGWIEQEVQEWVADRSKNRIEPHAVRSEPRSSR
jgi:prophage regulatory protein